MTINKYFKQSGQSIIEVLIATGVVALVMTAMMAAMTLSLQNSSQAKYRSLATKLGQEGVENIRQYRDKLGWETFYQIINSQGNGLYCLNTLPATNPQLEALTSGACQTYSISQTGVNFKREILIDVLDENQIRLEVNVSWLDGSDPINDVRKTTVVHELKNWR